MISFDLENRWCFYFKQIANIPRGSGNEKEASDYIVQFAKDHGLQYKQDSVWNVIVDKPASPGYENAEPVILQAHLDVVCEKNQDVEHDFTKDPLDLYVEDGYIRARGTTLGADNGIGLSYFLAVLDSKDIPHPPIETAFTVMEEMGKVGGNGFDTKKLTGKRMIDLNWHKDDYLLAGCGGDVSVKYTIPAVREDAPADAKFYSLDTFGMVGGHCEFDIVLERANSIKVLGRLLNNILHAAPGVKVAAVSGGVQNNVIPSESNAVLAVKDSDLETVKKAVADTYAELKDEYSIADKGLTVEFKETEKCSKVFTDKTAQIITQSILLTPNAVMSMSMKIPGISECSNNIGLMTTDEKEITIISTITSSVTTRKHEVMKTIFALADAIGNGVKAEQFGCDAPEWIYNPDSPMLAIAKKAYEEEVGEPAKIEVMPASLELGLFQDRIPGLDIIAVGTVTHGVHSPSEECEVASVGKVWKIFKNMLAQMKD